MNGERKTTLHKVKAHTSIIGNEKADEIAKAAATGETPYAECELYDTPSNDRSTQYWPYVTKWQNFWERENGQRRLIDRVKQLTDLQDSARKHCHQTSRFGMPNRTTCYFEAFKKIEDTLDLAASNQFMTSGKVTFAGKSPSATDTELCGLARWPTDVGMHLTANASCVEKRTVAITLRQDARP